jgi:hypothetical protein
LVIVVVLVLGPPLTGGTAQPGDNTTSGSDDAAKAGVLGTVPEHGAKEQLDGQPPTTESKAPAELVLSKEEQLTEFQKANDISDRIAAAAIKEWVATHDGAPDWSLEEVKTICLRNKRDGIPENYLPESEKDK